MSRLFQNQHIAMTDTRYGIMAYNVHDRFVGRSLEIYGEWAASEIDVLTQCVPEGGIVLDVGANIGTHTVPLAKKVGNSGGVIAFEPQRHSFQLLAANVVLNGLTNVDVRRVAVGRVRGAVAVPVLDPTAAQNFGGLSLGESVDASAGERVPVVLIDELGLGRCDLIKVDVEGMECDVLAGARATIETHQPVLFVENNTEAGSAHIIDAVLGFDYRAYWHLAGYYNPQNFRACVDNVFENFQPEANMLCVHKSVPVEGLPEVTGPDDDWRQARARLLAAA